jgi:hypothetical protein
MGVRPGGLCADAFDRGRGGGSGHTPRPARAVERSRACPGRYSNILQCPGSGRSLVLSRPESESNPCDTIPSIICLDNAEVHVNVIGPTKDDERALVANVINAPWLAGQVEERARAFAIAHLVPAHLAEVKRRRLAEIDKVEREVRARRSRRRGENARRTREYRARLARGLRIVPLHIRNTEIDGLIECRLLVPERRDDPAEVAAAVGRLFDCITPTAWKWLLDRAARKG